MSDDLLSALGEAELTNQHSRPCQACRALESVSGETRAALERALSGTIGETRLARILSAHGHAVGRRAIRRHRQEGH